LFKRPEKRVDRLAPLCFSIPGLTLAAAFGVLRNIIRS